MAMTADERTRVIAMLDEMDSAQRSRVLSSIHAFVDWMADALSWLYDKISGAIGTLYQKIRDFFS